METKEDRLNAIYDSYVNGQFTQMTNQLKDYGMYEVFEDMRRFLGGSYPSHFSDSIIVNMVIAFNHIRYR